MMKIYLMLSYIGWGWTVVVLIALMVGLKLKGNRGDAEARRTDAEEKPL
jgi:hypothetical protein